MKNRKIAVILDTILTFFISFFVCLLIFSTLNRGASIKYILGCIFSLCLSIIVFIHKKNKYDSIMLNQKEIHQLKSLMLTLELMPDNEVIALLVEFLMAYNVHVKMIDGKLKFNNTIYLFNFNKQLTREMLCNQLKGINCHVVFFCNSITNEAEELLSFLKDRVTIINGEGFFKLMNNVNFDTQALIQTKKSKIDIKAITAKAFTKKRAFRYTAASATLLLFSKFTFFPTYYKICAAVLLLLSLLCMIFGKKDKKVELSEIIFKQT